jgi:hypothetical protein
MNTITERVERFQRFAGFEDIPDSILELINAAQSLFEIPPDKSPLVVNGWQYAYYLQSTSLRNNQFHSSGGTGNPDSDLVNSTSPWSESSYILTPSGDMPGFEDRQPQIVSPDPNGSIPTNGNLQWQMVDAADAYLVYLQSGSGQEIIAVTQETMIAPPFPEEQGAIEGLKGADRFTSGKTYTWQVCALRVKSGLLGFVVEGPIYGGLPTVSPRYEHPSGIMLQSRWSEAGSFTAQ